MPDNRQDYGSTGTTGTVGSVGKSQQGQPSLGVFRGADQNGHVVFASDALLVQLDALGHLSDALRLCSGDLLGILDRTTIVQSIGFDTPLAAVDSRRLMEAALRALMTAQLRAARIREGIVRSRQAYVHSEEGTLATLHAVDEQIAWGLGALVRVFALPLGVFVLDGLAVARLVFGKSPGQLATGAQSFLKDHGRILTNPATVALIREAASDADGFEAGFAGIPQGVAQALESLGISGVPSGAAGVIAAGNVVGLLKETPVSVHKTSAFEFGKPATSLLDRASSFPDAHSDPGGEQIRIDRYVEPGHPDRFDVYVSGTVTFDPKTGSQAFDFASDLWGVAGRSPGSLRAVEEALAQAGVTPSSPIVLNGYSQGGLVASLVAASGNYNVKGVVTFGAPSSQVHIPASIPVLSVRNTEDLVPATSGYDVNPNALIVERSVFSHSPVPNSWAVPAHRLEYYQQTAAVIDDAGSRQVRAVLDPLNSFGAGAHRVDSTLWVATRTTIQPTVHPTPALAGVTANVPIVPIREGGGR